MALESASFIHQLDPTNPTAGDPKSQGDDHIRLLKTTVKATFPNVLGAVSVTHSELNALAGVLGAGATLNVPTQVLTDSSLRPASTAFVQAAISTLVGSAAVPAWVSGMTYAIGALVYSPANFQTYRRRTNGAGTTDPSADGTNWERMTSGGALLYEARTANTALVDTDFGKFVDITSGTFSQTFASVASLRNGWWLILRNSGTGDITLDPTGTEQIDGLTSYVMYPGEARLIQCNGSALRSVVLQPFSKTYTTSIAGGFVKPPGYARFGGLMWGGGASGAKDASTAGGGGGGACHSFTVMASALSATEDITIGAGGDAVTSALPGNPGGYSCIGPVLTPKVASYGGGDGRVTAGGGGGGVLGAGNAPGFTVGGDPGGSSASTASGNAGFGGAVGGGTSGSPRQAGAAAYGGGGGGGVAATAALNVGGNALYGGAGGGGVNSTGGTAAGGTSVYGGAGGASSNTGNGGDGVAPGGGGGATRTGTRSGAGARGEIRIWGL